MRRGCFGKDGREVIVMEIGMSPPLIFFFSVHIAFLFFLWLNERYVLAELVDFLPWGRYLGAGGCGGEMGGTYFVWVLGVERNKGG